jgi:hypothetical protein
MNTLDTLVITLRDLDVADSAIRATLKKKGFSEDEILAAVPKNVKRGFAADYYDFLVNGCDREEAEAFILSSDSKNVRENNLKHYLSLFDLVERVRNA